jgi:hypothetical protein
MAWGQGGEEVRERAKIALAQSREPLYKLRQCACQLEHPEKGPLLRTYVNEVYAVLERIEALLCR